MSKTRLAATENLYRTADGEIVREGDKRAAFHVVRVGSQVPDEWEKAVRAFLGDQPDPDADPNPVPDEPTAEAAVTEAPDDGEKASVKVEDKAADTAPNKAVKKTAKKVSKAAKKS